MEPSFDNFLSDLSSDRWNARRAAARGLGELGNHQAVEPLLEWLRVEDWVSVRSALGDALRQLCDARDVPRLAEVLPALPEDAQEGVIALLGDLRDARAVSALLKFVRSMGRRELKAEFGELLERMRRHGSPHHNPQTPQVQFHSGFRSAILSNLTRWR